MPDLEEELEATRLQAGRLQDELDEVHQMIVLLDLDLDDLEVRVCSTCQRHVRALARGWK